MKKLTRILITSLVLVLSLMGVSSAYAEDDLVPVKFTATYGQTEARTILDTINGYRAGELTDGGESVPWCYASGEAVGGVKDYDSYSNLQPLTYDYDLEKAAMVRAMEVAISFSHTRPNGESISKLIPRTFTASGENIAAGQRTAAAVMNSWMEANEPYSGQGHRRSILNSRYTHVGIGHVVMNGIHYWVQEFGGTTNSSYTTEETEANDSTVEYETSVLKSNIKTSSCLIKTGTSSIVMDIGDDVSLPDITTYLCLNEYWGANRFKAETPCSWSVGDDSIAEISGDKIIAKAYGTTTLTVSMDFDSSISCDVELTVRKAYPLTGISLSETALSLHNSEMFSLELLPEPANTTDEINAVWSSSDESVATVNSKGVVTATGVGDATINVQVGDFAANCAVHVVAMEYTEFSSLRYTTSGTLSDHDNDGVGLEDRVARGYKYYGHAGETIQVDMVTESYNTWVYILDENMESKGSHTWYGTSHHSRCQFTFEEDGWCYIQACRYYDTDAGGDFELQVNTPVTEVTINTDYIKLGIGETAELYVTSFSPENTTEDTDVVYGLNDNDRLVVEVKDGVVTALRPGKIDMVVCVGSGFARCTIVVTQPIVNQEIDTIPYNLSSKLDLESGEYDGSYSDGTICRAYHFNGIKGETLAVVLEAQKFYPCIQVLNSKGSRLAANYNSNYSHSVDASCTLPADGDYYIRVYSKIDFRGGDFTMDISSDREAIIAANKAQELISRIEALPEVSEMTLYDREAIEEILTLKAELTDEQLALLDEDVIQNLNDAFAVLSSVEERLDELIEIEDVVDHVAGVDPTCDEAGSIEYWYREAYKDYYSDAELTQRINQEDIALPALHHGKLKHFDRVEATCTEAGNAEYWQCEYCSLYFGDDAAANQIKEGSWVIGKKEHVYGDWQITTEPACTKAGEQKKVCTGCGNTISEPITALGHDFEDFYTEDQPASCIEDGSMSKHCKNCDAVDDVQSIKALGHNYVTETRDATCTEEGLSKKVCSRCNDTIEETIPAKGHAMDHYDAVAATCTEPGHEAYEKCSRCGFCGGYVEIPATGKHVWKHVIIKAGLLKNGSEYDQCTVCKTKKNVKKLTGYATYYVKGFKLASAKAAFTAKWTKQSKKNQKKFNGYQIRYSTKSSMAGAKYATAGKSSASKKISKLKKKTKYYVQVRTYTISKNVKYYSKWSAKKTVKTK